MERRCEVCGVEFDAGRSTARFCSGACRLALHRKEVSVTEKVSVTEVSAEKPCNVFTGTGEYLDLEKDLRLDLKKDLGIYSWSKDGIFIRSEITIDRVQNIASLIHAKNGRSCPRFWECR